MCCCSRTRCSASSLFSWSMRRWACAIREFRSSVDNCPAKGNTRCEGRNGNHREILQSPLPPTQALQGVIDSELALGRVSEHLRALDLCYCPPKTTFWTVFPFQERNYLGFFWIIPSCNLHFHSHVTLRDCQQLCHISWFLNHHIFSPLPAHRAAGNVTVRDRQLHLLFNSPPDQLLLIRFLAPDCAFQVLLLRGQHNSQPHCPWERTQASPAAVGDLRRALQNAVAHFALAAT